jgi:thiamine-phosphate pyrophosphorylase
MAPQSFHRPRLYLIAPPAEQISADFRRQLEAALAGGDAAALLLPAPGQGAFAADFAEALIRIAQSQNVAALIENDPAAAKALNADGVHVTTGGGAVRGMRIALGESAIVGAYCGLSRHDAMLAGETGADYVAFGASPIGGGRPDERRSSPLEAIAEAVAWWSRIMEPPVVAWLDGNPVWGRDAAARLVRAGADFLGVGGMVWTGGEGPRAETEALNALCESGAEKKTGTGHA